MGELSFSKNDIITNIVKETENFWRGDTKLCKQGWFPAKLVEEIDPDTASVEEVIILIIFTSDMILSNLLFSLYRISHWENCRKAAFILLDAQ